MRIFEAADTFHAESRATVIFFSDLTRWLDARGSHWADLDTDWEAGLAFCDETVHVLDQPGSGPDQA